MFFQTCVLFPDSSHRVAKQLISKLVDWKDLLEDIKNHTFTEYHLNSIARFNEFMRTMNHPEKGIGPTISGKIIKNLKRTEKF